MSPTDAELLVEMQNVQEQIRAAVRTLKLVVARLEGRDVVLAAADRRHPNGTH